MTPKSSKHINIDTILLEMAKPLLNNNDRVFVLDTDIKEAKQQLYDLMLEIIYDEETIRPMVHRLIIENRNEDGDYDVGGISIDVTELLLEQRQKLNHLFGKETK